MPLIYLLLASCTTNCTAWKNHLHGTHPLLPSGVTKFSVFYFLLKMSISRYSLYVILDFLFFTGNEYFKVFTVIHLIDNYRR